MTEVVNVRVKHIRPEYQDLKEWMQDEDNIYIGRGGIVFIDGERFPKENSVWANPYKVEKDGTLEEVLEKYEIYIRKKIIEDGLDIETLRGKNLGCWCKIAGKDIPCHGDILLKILEENDGPIIEFIDSDDRDDSDYSDEDL